MLVKLYFTLVIVWGYLGFRPIFGDIITTAPGGSVASGYQDTQQTIVGSSLWRGFFQARQGITGGTVTLNWDGDGSINGNLNFTALLTLKLHADLVLGSTARLMSANTGIINGQGFTIHANGDLLIDKNLFNLAGNLTIDGHGHKITSTGYFGAGSGVPVISYKNMILTKTKQNNNSYLQTGCDILWDNVSFLIPSYANVGNSAGYVSGNSPFKLIGTSGRTLTIQGLNSIEGYQGIICPCNGVGSLVIKKNSTLRIGRGVSVDFTSLSVLMEDPTSVLWLDGCTLYTGSGGLTLTKGTVIITDKVVINNGSFSVSGGNYTSFSPNTNMSNALNFGDGLNPANNCNVKVMGGAYVVVNGCMYNNNL